MRKRTFLKITMVVAVLSLLALAILTPPATAQGRSDEALQHVIEVQERHTPALMAMPGVVGTAVGYNRDGRLSVNVFVETGSDAVGIPRHLDGIPVAVRVTGQIVALRPQPGHGGPGGQDGGTSPSAECTSTTGRFRPACIGISTGHPTITAGTIGCRVVDRQGNVYALSNNHVYAASNQAIIGDAVLQPGAYDGGTALDDMIGSLADFEPIDFDGGENTIDAAIAIVSEAALGNATPSDGYGMPKSTTMLPSLNMKVKKYGRTTALTKGTITGLHATVNVNYGDAGVARFVGQVIITGGEFSAGGDSGSLIVVDGKGKTNADDRKPVALLFAGGINMTIANPIDAILENFDVTVDGQ
jgi:hypothetical protein